MLCATDGHAAGLNTLILPITAPGIVFGLPDEISRDGVLMDVSDERDEVSHIVDGFALEAVLEQLALALVLLVVMDSIRDANALDDRRQSLGTLSDEEMNMVGHEAIGVEGATGWKRMTELVDRTGDLFDQFQKLPEILGIFEDVLLVDTSEHYVIDASTAGLS